MQMTETLITIKHTTNKWRRSMHPKNRRRNRFTRFQLSVPLWERLSYSRTEGRNQESNKKKSITITITLSVISTLQQTEQGHLFAVTFALEPLRLTDRQERVLARDVHFLGSSSKKSWGAAVFYSRQESIIHTQVIISHAHPQLWPRWCTKKQSNDTSTIEP
jgi:hypothetical protein